jgi:hypothetical protein
VDGNAMQDSGMVTANDAGDFGVAVAAVRMVPHEPPQLVASGSDGAASSATAQFVAGDTAVIAHGIDEV